jgi:polysaccharide export outer membrane protein
MTTSSSSTPAHTPRRVRAAALRLVAASVALATAQGCSHSRDYLWVNEAAPTAATAADGAYRIAPGDVLGVRVWNQDAMSIERARVREDGKISLPFLNDVEVAGMEPAEIGKRLEVKLKTFIVNPVVTVLVQERVPVRVSVIGEVARPGTYELERGAGVLHALAAAGGVSAFAHDSGVYVLRAGYWADGNPAPGRIRFRYSDLCRGAAPAAAFHLLSGDVVVVE